MILKVQWATSAAIGLYLIKLDSRKYCTKYGNSVGFCLEINREHFICEISL